MQGDQDSIDVRECLIGPVVTDQARRRCGLMSAESIYLADRLEYQVESRRRQLEAAALILRLTRDRRGEHSHQRILWCVRRCPSVENVVPTPTIRTEHIVFDTLTAAGCDEEKVGTEHINVNLDILWWFTNPHDCVPIIVRFSPDAVRK